MTADLRLLGITLAATGQLFLAANQTLHHALDDLFGHDHGLGGLRLRQQFFHRVFVFLILDQRGVERLGELRAIAVKRIGLQCQLPGEHVGRTAILNRCLVRHVDRLGDRA